MFRSFVSGAQLLEHRLRQALFNNFQASRLRDVMMGFARQIGKVLWEFMQAFPRLESAVILGLAASAAVTYCFGA